MERIHFTDGNRGFYGTYYPNPNKTHAAILARIGDDPDDRLAKSGVKWLHRKNVNVLTLSPGKKDYSYHSYPLEKIGKALDWLKDNGNNLLGIVGASTTATLALTAASYFNAITLTRALSPSDFVFQGFRQGNRDGCKEWPMEGESLFTYKGFPIPYRPFCFSHPDYYHRIQKESKETNNFVASRILFDESEKKSPIKEEAFIQVERIQGSLLLVGAKDDALWDCAKYIQRREQRLKERKHGCNVTSLIYDHGTHFVFPQTRLKTRLPIGSSLFMKMAFKAARDYPKECLETRKDIDRKRAKAIRDWRREK